jgi:hypothetical protein
MPKKRWKDKRILEVNGFPIHLELSDSEIIINDENNNNIRISKKIQQSIILNLEGIFSSKK